MEVEVCVSWVDSDGEGGGVVGRGVGAERADVYVSTISPLRTEKRVLLTVDRYGIPWPCAYFPD